MFLLSRAATVTPGDDPRENADAGCRLQLSSTMGADLELRSEILRAQVANLARQTALVRAARRAFFNRPDTGWRGAV
jgi:hypothetical protein